MHLGQDPELDVLRQRVRDLIATHEPPRSKHAGARAPEPDELPALRSWMATLYREGFLGVGWPVEYGGLAEPDPQHEAVVAEELARAGAPSSMGAGMLAASALMQFGTPEQQAMYLPRIRSSEHIWCQLFSEPGAGSDLASMQTRARREGDTYIIDGQKVWTTLGQYADWGYLLARTNPDVSKHRGITAFAVDMTTPGIDVRPLREITGTADFNEVFFNGVVIPAENVIGQVDDGWVVAMSSLAKERSAAGGGQALFRALDDLLAMTKEIERDGRPVIERDDVRQRLGAFMAETHANALLSAYRESRALHGTGDAADAPMSKVFFSEVNLALAEYGFTVQGADGVRIEGDEHAMSDGWWQDYFMYARAYTIAGGANEVLRNVIAERALGLPR